jgi:hypothetical protein
LACLGGSAVPPLVHRRLRRRVLGQSALRCSAGRWLRASHPAHINHPNRCNRRGCILPNLLYFRDRKWAPRILRQCSLLPFKWHRRRRRRGSSDHRPA